MCAGFYKRGVVMRKAFTLLELLAVIAIITLLIGILLPAVQGVREGGRKTRCIYNQRNLAIALQHYESKERRLPGWRDFITIAPPQGMNAAPGLEVAAQASWIFCILPQIEETSLYDRIKSGQVAVGMAIPSSSLLNCPSHTESATSRATNYVVNGGAVDNFMTDEVTPDGNVANGPFLDRAWIIALTGDPELAPKFPELIGKVARFEEISRMDGTTYTLLTSENVQRGFWISEEITHFYHQPDGQIVSVPLGAYDTLPEPDGRYTVPFTGAQDTIEGSVAFCWPRFYNLADQGSTICYPQGDFNNSSNPKQGFSGACDNIDDDVFSFNRNPYDSERIPCYFNMFRRKTFTSWYHSARPSSNHRGTVIASFCDGTVRPISESIDEWVFVHLMTAGASQSDAGKRIPGRNFLEGKLFDPSSFDRL